MALAAVTLDDKYELESGRVFLTGTQALVRLPMMQRHRDLKAGLNTAAFVSGYRGSPLGGLDQAFWQAKRFLAKNHIHFQSGINEDMAATAVWGSQQVGIFPGAKYDGVNAMWYGKGPGVDRCGDVFKHGNFAGSAKHGGVLLLAGDDHAAKSSTLPHQSEYAFMSAMIPVLNPAGVQEFLDLGTYAWALSRYSGCWVGFITVADTVESSASVYVDPHRVEIQLPADFEMPPGGLNIRWPDQWMGQEERLMRHKLYAALAFARANRFDRLVIDSPKRRFGIVTTGKSYLDVRQALDDLGIDEAHAAELGLSLYKVAMSWPLEREGMRRFAEGLEEILVVEEKRALIENQLKEQLYNWRADVRPRVVGKFDENYQALLPSYDELTPARVARVIAGRIERFYTSERIRDRLAFLAAKEKMLQAKGPDFKRTPYFCSGCPHNTSTVVPEGSRATAGIGCHFMAVWMDRSTATYTHMGGEGAPWIGFAPFTEEKHIFANLGDGTYFHSGYLAIRAAVAAKVNITYKILYNDAVAMTGGQHVDGQLTVPQVTQQVYGEGVRRIAVVTDQPEKYPMGAEFAPGTTVHHRSELQSVQKELREWQGTSVLVYDQTCAAEKRRRRKRGTFPDPAMRAFINEAVCEGCGDCGVKSNCLSVVPVETELGRKRQIDQSSCNKDFSCVNGFCPSFVTVHGGRLRKSKAAAAAESDPFAALPEPALPRVGDEPYNILVTGVGGTGVVTIGALLGMASHLEGKGASVLDMTGLAQKGGAVLSHVRIARRPEDIHATRVAAGEAKLVLGCDLVVAAGSEALGKVREGVTRVVINSHETPTGDFTRNPDMAFPSAALIDVVRRSVGEGSMDVIEATRLATALLGDSIATNLFMLGFAYQRGLVPVSGEAILKAIELNAVAVEMNRNAFFWGRLAAHDLARVERTAAPKTVLPQRLISRSLDEIVGRRAVELTAYQNAAYAERYKSLVERVIAAESEKAKGMSGLAEAVARYYYKLLAYKDEYEVARLFTDGTFTRALNEQFEGDYKLEFHLAPPLVAERDPETGELKKRKYGRWVIGLLRLLKHMKGLRGTRLDPFGNTAERKRERALIAEYEAVIAELLAGLDHDNHALAVEIAALPEHIRGYGHVKERHIAQTKVLEAELLAAFRAPPSQRTAAE
ncbi:MAG TPA: indolepyruvate ferredoxin oxidoreductase family protein [Alphaproteobacteria bacterium]|nr:indolepyruvate ferredoxin oxidoreductase family protein [Alphaproteobacteria bacterium]